MSAWEDDESFGVDLAWRDDLDPSAREVTGRELLAQECYHRLTTPRGQLLTDPDYGMDLRAELSVKATAARRASLGARISAEITKDDRVLRADVSVVWLSTSAADFAIKITPVDPSFAQPFDLILSVTDATARIKAGD